MNVAVHVLKINQLSKPKIAVYLTTHFFFSLLKFTV